MSPSASLEEHKGNIEYSTGHTAHNVKDILQRRKRKLGEIGLPMENRIQLLRKESTLGSGSQVPGGDEADTCVSSDSGSVILHVLESIRAIYSSAIRLFCNPLSSLQLPVDLTSFKQILLGSYPELKTVSQQLLVNTLRLFLKYLSNKLKSELIHIATISPFNTVNEWAILNLNQVKFSQFLNYGNTSMILYHDFMDVILASLEERMPDSFHQFKDFLAACPHSHLDTQYSPSSYKQEYNTVDLDHLLSKATYREHEQAQGWGEVCEIVDKPTFKEVLFREKYRSGNGYFREFCSHGTKTDCKKAHQAATHCSKIHFSPILHPHTEFESGDCSYLNTCHKIETCKYVHYQLDHDDKVGIPLAPESKDEFKGMVPGQWIHCDVRKFDLSILGKFNVIMADPPWDIHMQLPYGTMSDDEMREMRIPALQDEGFIFLWVTGRAMELGRECLQIWGYQLINELIWVKLNQLQRIIRTGRTGHWINHSKEHCLIGVKGDPFQCKESGVPTANGEGVRAVVNPGLNTDVLVSEVRETSRKPDEIYGLIEKLIPGGRKIEIFGRPHNVRPGWLTLGNQLDDVRLFDKEIVRRYNDTYGTDKKVHRVPEGVKVPQWGQSLRYVNE